MYCCCCAVICVWQGVRINMYYVCSWPMMLALRAWHVNRYWERSRFGTGESIVVQFPGCGDQRVIRPIVRRVVRSCCVCCVARQLCERCLSPTVTHGSLWVSADVSSITERAPQGSFKLLDQAMVSCWSSHEVTKLINSGMELIVVPWGMNACIV